MTEYPFPKPNSNIGYSLFPNTLEDDPNILFHGTSIENLDLIVNEGFKSGAELDGGTDPNFKLDSISFAMKSNQCLGHVCQHRDKGNLGDYVVFAVEFDSIDLPGIKVNPSDVHVYDKNIKPIIIGYTVVPNDYKFI
jgi:hypothetical protein